MTTPSESTASVSTTSAKNASAKNASAKNTARVEAARTRYDDATRAARRARIDAADTLRDSAIRRSRRFRRIMVAVLVTALAMGGALVAVSLSNRAADARAVAGEGAMSAAGAAITTMLTADPERADEYATRIESVSTGAQLERLTAGRTEIVDAISGLSERSIGAVIDTGLLTDPESDDDGAHAEVLVVADASNPELLGVAPDSADASDAGAAAGQRRRLLLEVEVVRTGGLWLVERVGTV